MGNQNKIKNMEAMSPQKQRSESIKSVKSQEKLPHGIRGMIYSYLPLSVLIDTICRISKYERKLISSSDLLDQPRILKVPTSLLDI